MAKLWILSDLHLETLPYPDNFRPAPPAFDVLVAAGDIQEGDPGRGFAVLRRLAGGGRPIVRTILDLAALQASRRCAIFRDFRQRLQLAGKPTKAALTATARKLLVTLNAMLASGTDYTPAAAI